VILPRDNEKDLSEIPANIQEELTIRFVETMDDVLDLALERKIDARVAIEAEPEASPALSPSTHDAGREPLTN
jgi:ATP-dependent Lon protease